MNPIKKMFENNHKTIMDVKKRLLVPIEERGKEEVDDVESEVVLESIEAKKINK